MLVVREPLRRHSDAAAVGLILANADVAIRVSRDLRQVRDDQHLVALAESGKALRQMLGDAATADSESTSSNTMVSSGSPSVAVSLSASMTRDSSPPDATLVKARVAPPGWQSA